MKTFAKPAILDRSTMNELASLWLALLLAVLAVVAGPAPNAHAATITVNSLLDVVNPNDGQCTLREAITAANTDTASGPAPGECVAGTPGADIIDLNADTYTLTIAGTNEDNNANGDLDITADLTINGADASTTIIDGNNIERVFHIPVNGITVNINDVTIQKGNETGGGGILINSSSVANISNSAISNNTAAFSAGGISNEGTLNILNSAISNNSVTDGSGGGIENFGTLNIANSTVSGNSTTLSAGGIANRQGTASLTHVTVTNNTANADNNLSGLGGGIVEYGGMVNIKSTIIAGNFDNPNNTGVYPDIFGFITSSGFNLIGNVGNTNFSTNTIGDQYGDTFGTTFPHFGVTESPFPIDPLLGPRVGNPAYHTLLTGTPTLDQIPLGSCTFISSGTNPLFSNGAFVTFDQTFSVTRPTDGDLDGTPECDVGAYEARAFTFNVNTTTDSSDITPGDERCADGSGDCSLRAAIDEANTLAGGPDTINVPAGTYTLTILGQNENNNATGDLDIISDMSINGAGAANTIIQAGPTPATGIDRVFHIVTNGITVDISDVTIQNGRVSLPGSGGGGGISNFTATVNISNSIIAFNQIEPLAHDGGGIASAGGTINISNSTISNNTARDNGGGIFLQNSTLNVINSTISGNRAQNTTVLGGGGVFNYQGTANIANSTISGNLADISGGGIFQSDGGSTNLTNVTITDNTADADNNGSGSGGGIFRRNPGGSIIIKSSLVAENFDTPNNAGPGATDPDIDGFIVSSGFNLIGNVGNTNFSSNTGGDQYGDPNGTTIPSPGATESATPIDPMLDPLTGSPAYHPLQPFSPAIDQIPGVNCTFISSPGNPLFTSGDPVTTDQPGTTRPLDSNLDGTPECDVGAVEFNKPALALVKLVDDPFPRLGQTITYTISIANFGPVIAGPGVVSDTQPAGLTFGPATVDSTIAPTIGPAPQLATDLVIFGGESISLTLPVTVNVSDTIISNIAEVSATNAPSTASDQIDITVGRQPCPLLGTDGFGYTCLDSIDPGGPAFAFEDISGTGSIVLNNNDDGEADVSLPFPFTFYDFTATDLTVGMNGAVIFGQTGQEIPAINLVLNGGTPNYIIAPFWDDLDDFPGNPSSAVYTDVRGSAPNRRFIVQWDDIPHHKLGGDVGGVTFQLILYEGSNEILFQYQDVDFGDAAFDDGAEASVGIRGNSTGNSLPYSFNEHLIKDGLAIRFIPPLVNLALTKTVDDAQPRLGQTITYTITVENVAPGMNVNDGIISDTIPAGLTFVGPVTFDPPGSGIPGILPQLATNLTITNGQSVTLTFPVSVNTADTVITNTAEVSASNAVITATGQVPISVGRQPCPDISPDGFGYTCLDSNDPGGPIFAFEDISGTGDQLFFADNNNGEANIFAMPFDFTYYNITANALTVGMNGAIIFGQTGQNISLANLSLASPATQNYMIAPFWDNLDNDQGVGGGVFFETRGAAPNRRFIIQWQDIPHTNDVGAATFQLILFEGSNEILFQYQDVDFGNAGLDDGNSASVGIRGNGTSNALPYARNEVLIKSGLAIRFFPPATNLIITKTAFPTTVEPGDPITYTITFSNQGADVATGVVITDQIPGTLTNVNVANSGATITDTSTIPAFVWDVQDLQPGQGGTITITAQTDPGLTSGGLFTNTTSISTQSVEDDTLNNTDEAGVTIDVEADLVITKTASPAIVESGDPITYTITFSNQGTGVASGVVITDQVPVTLTNVTVASSGVAITDTGAIPAFIWEVQDLEPGQGGIITITALIDPLLTNGSSFTNTAIISTTSVESDTLNNEDGAGVTITIADLVIDKIASPTVVEPGDPITYTITFSNQGTGVASGVVITDQLPVTLTNPSAVSSGVTITDTGTIPAFVWEVQNLQPGQGGTITITALIDSFLTSGGLFTNTATIDTTSVESDTLNNEAEAGVTIIVPDLTIAKTASPTTVAIGNPITFTLTFSNQGTSLATNISIFDTLPVTLTNIVVVSSGVAITDTGGTPFTWEVQDLQPGQGGTITITGLIDNLTSTGLYTNTAVIFTLGVDSDPDNDTAEAEFTVTASDLVLIKSVDEANPNAGEVITYTITVQNVGTADATGVVVSDTLPLSLTLAGPVTLDPPSAGTPGAPPLLATNVIISAGQSITITFPMTVSVVLSPETVITNTAAVTSLVVTTPQTDSVTITVGVSGGGSNVYLPLIIKDQ